MQAVRDRKGGMENGSKLGPDWVPVCSESDLVIGSGVCAKLQGEQVALFRPSADEEVLAIANYDPIGKANVLSRGIIGSLGERLVVASPLYKQHFDLHSGECLEQPELGLKTWRARLEGGTVWLQTEASGPQH